MRRQTADESCLAALYPLLTSCFEGRGVSISERERERAGSGSRSRERLYCVRNVTLPGDRRDTIALDATVRLIDNYSCVPTPAM